jgi:carbonic anhydrase
MEMHTVSLPNKNERSTEFMAAAVGIIFDVNNYSKNVSERQVEIIDDFFEKLGFNKRNHVAIYINYGELIDALDTENRWVYKGSVTTPPCATTVYWNVLRTVYPIK